MRVALTRKIALPKYPLTLIFNFIRGKNKAALNMFIFN